MASLPGQSRASTDETIVDTSGFDLILSWVRDSWLPPMRWASATEPVSYFETGGALCKLTIWVVVRVPQTRSSQGNEWYDRDDRGVLTQNHEHRRPVTQQEPRPFNTRRS